MNFKRISVRVALGVLGMMLAWLVFHSVQVPLVTDSVYLHYAAYLIGEHGFVPYRDLFEINFPLTYLVHVLIGKVFGFGEFALRLFGFLSLIGLLVLISRLFRPIHRAVGWFVAISFGLLYLSRVNNFFQRDFLVLIPTVIIIQSTLKLAHRREFREQQWLSLGVWAALAALIKPHYAAILPVALLSVFTFFKLPLTLKMTCRAMARMALGFSIPVMIMIAGLSYLDGWEAFVELVMEYLPLYAEFRNVTEPMQLFKMMRRSALVFIVAVNILSFWEQDERIKSWLRTFSILFLLGTVIGSVQGGHRDECYLFSNLMFFALLGISMTMQPDMKLSRLPAATMRLLPIGLGLLVFVHIYLISVFIPNAMQAHQLINSVNLRRKAFIVEYFEQHTSGKESIQPYQWGLNVCSALLDLERPIATKYICALQFHHSESEPYIQNEINQFVKIIQSDMPDYFVISLPFKCLPVRPEVQEILDEFYEVDAENMRVIIYKKISHNGNK